MQNFKNGKWTSPTIRRALSRPKGAKPTNAVGIAGGGNWTPMGYGYANEVSPKAPDSVVTYYACKRNIAQDMATLPFRLQKREIINGRKSAVPLDGDILDLLLNYAPNPTMNSYHFWETMFFHRMGGNAYAEIVPQRSMNKVAELWIIHPSRCPRGAQMGKDGRVFYEVYDNSGALIRYPADRMLHLMNTSADGLNGMSVAELMANPLGTANNAGRFQKSVMANQARPGLVIKSVNTLGRDTRIELAKEFNEAYGGPENAGKTLVMDLGLDVTPLKLNFEELQMLELRQYTDEEFARAFRMPLRMLQIIKTAQGWSTLSGEEKDYCNSCLSPIAKDTELEIRRKLMPLQSYPLNIEAHFEMKGRLKGSADDQVKYCTAMFAMGAMSPNEVRAYADMNPVDDPMMDKTYVQQGFAPIDMAGKLAEAAVKQKALPQSSGPKEELEVIPAPIEKRLTNGVH